MSKKTHIGAGNVEIELDGETVVLRPSLRAAQVISRQAGGIMAAITAVGRYDFDVIASVVALGIGASDSESKDVPNKVFTTGLTDLIGPVTKFLSNLANGGRPMDAGTDDGGNPPNG